MSLDAQSERFLAAALEAGHLAAEQADECRQAANVLRDLDTQFSIDDIAIKKGFISRRQADELKRAIAGTRVGKYEVLAQLGKGALGVVWRARDTHLDRVVALKLLKSDVQVGDAVVHRFEREARIALTLNHANIVRGFDTGEDAGYRYLALEFVPGETLTEAIKRRGRLPEKEVCEIALEMAAALRHLGEFDLVHRDIKPDNVILSAEGHTKLIDLGLTRAALEQADELGVTEQALGTPTYASPEQIQRPDHIDWRADLYSLGVTLYHALTGRPPFTGSDAREISRKHLDVAPRDPRELELSISAGAANVVLKMLHKDPNGRYSCIEHMEEDLRAVIAGTVPTHTLAAAPVVPAGPKPSVAPKAGHRPAARAAERRKKSSPVPLIVGVVLVAGVAFAGWKISQNQGDTAPETPTTEPGEAPTSSGTDATAGGAQPADGSSDQPDDPSTDDPSPDEPVFEGRTALESAAAFLELNPGDFEGASEQFEFVREKYGSSEIAADIDAEYAKFDALRREAAKEEFQARRDRADAALAEGRIGAAWQEFEDFPRAFEDTPAAKHLAEASLEMAAKAQAAIDTATAAVKAAIAEGRFDDARIAIRTATLAETPDTASAIVALRDSVTAQEGRWDLAREDQAAGFATAYASVLLEAGTGALDAARARLEEARSKFTHYQLELRSLEADVADVERLQALLRAEWKKKSGTAVTVGSPSQPGESVDGKIDGLEGDAFVVDADRGGRTVVPLAALFPDAAPVLVAAGLDQRSAADQRALLHFELSGGALARAESQVEVLRLVGGDADAARAAYERVAGHLQQMVQTFLDEAELARRQRRFDEALAQLDLAASVVVSHPSVELARGHTLLEKGDEKGAIAVLSSLIASGRAPVEARLRLAQAQREDKELEAAQTTYREFLDEAGEDHPLRPEGESELAELTQKLNETLVKQLSRTADRAFRKKDWPAAVAGYERLIQVAPDDPMFSFNLGIALLRQGKSFEGFRQLTIYVREHPKHKKVTAATKELAAVTDRFGTAQADDREKARKAAGEERNGRLDQAIELYTSALVFSPFLSEARLGLARSLRARGKRDGSTADLERGRDVVNDILLIDPDQMDALEIRADVLMALGDAAGALADADRLCEANKAADAPRLLAGRALMLLGRPGEAYDRFEEALDIRPSAEAFYGKALALEKEGHFNEALSTLDEMVEQFEVTGPLADEVRAAMRRIGAKADE